MNPGEKAVVFGASGCGKSTLTRKLASQFHRRIVFDRLREWRGDFLFCQGVKSFKKLYAEKKLLGEFTIVVQFPLGVAAEAVAHECDDIFREIYLGEQGLAHVGNNSLALVFEELWFYAPLHSPPAWFVELCLTGRHQRISMIANAQKSSTVSKIYTSQCGHFFYGQFADGGEFESVQKIFGRGVINASPKKFCFWYARPGEVPVMIQN